MSPLDPAARKMAARTTGTLANTKTQQACTTMVQDTTILMLEDSQQETHSQAIEEIHRV